MDRYIIQIINKKKNSLKISQKTTAISSTSSIRKEEVNHFLHLL